MPNVYFIDGSRQGMEFMLYCNETIKHINDKYEEEIYKFKMCNLSDGRKVRVYSINPITDEYVEINLKEKYERFESFSWKWKY